MTNSLLRFSTFRAEAHVSPIRNTRAILFGDARCPSVTSTGGTAVLAVPERRNLSATSDFRFRIPPMRKVVLGLGISLDGYIARADGAVDFLFMPKAYSMGPFFATIDTAIMGRKTYDDALKMGGGDFSGAKMKNYVFSHSQSPGKRGGVSFVNESTNPFIEKIRNQPGNKVWLM